MFVVVEEGGRVSNPPLRPRWERPARRSDRYEQDSQPGPWFDRLTTNVGLDSPFATSAGSVQALSSSKGGSDRATLLVQSPNREKGPRGACRAQSGVMK